MAKSGDSPFAWVSDHDVDLLLCAELHGSPALAALMLEAAGLPQARFRRASLAVGEPRPDLLIEAETASGETVAVFVDHRPASAPPMQLPDDGPWRHACALRLAPGVAVAGVAGGSHVLTYESLIGWLAGAANGHGAFLADVLRAAVEARERQPAASSADESVAAFWTAYWNLASQRNPQLRMKQPQGVPSGRTWPWFAEADGLRRGIALVHKTDRGAVDLTFANTSVDSLRAAALPLLRPGVRLHSSRMQAVLRIDVPIVNMYRPFAPQQAAVETGLDAAERLRQLFAANADALDIVPLI